ncbi:OLC1v1024490C1 [Oldenlandia corymbosa var. corymbosa]|uniref:OLC1v1024490C1 n=1 Tax=Oldenlandia corymbosa var. corymbosa TaxID=529605 RepID=A0AAV1C487_OLDCO|nr:OLC1v1024490C1 [Oldenlandia corymbosa var. corymbosa]
MSSGVTGCTQVASKSVEGRMEAQVQLMKSQINYLHDALAEVKEANRDLSQLLSNQQDKAMNGRSIQSYFEELEGLFLCSGVDENDYMLTNRFHYGLDKGFKQHPKIRRQSRLYEAYYAALEVEREHDTSCGWNGPIEDQGLVFGAEDGDQRTCIFRTKCSVGWSNEVDLVIDEVDDSRTNPLKEGGDDENHIAFHGDSPSECNELVLHSSFGMPSLLCRPIKEERMDLNYLCDRELVQESYDQDDENVINFGVQTKGDDDLMEISAQEYQGSLTLEDNALIYTSPPPWRCKTPSSKGEGLSLPSLAVAPAPSSWPSTVSSFPLSDPLLEDELSSSEASLGDMGGVAIPGGACQTEDWGHIQDPGCLAGSPRSRTPPGSPASWERVNIHVANKHASVPGYLGHQQTLRRVILPERRHSFPDKDKVLAI